MPILSTNKQRVELAAQLRPVVAAQKERLAVMRRKWSLLDEVAALRAREKELAPIAKTSVLEIARRVGVRRSTAYRIKSMLNKGKI